MTRTRSMLAILLGLALTTEAAAQFFPIIGLPTVVQPGIGFQMGGKQVQVGGFVPLGDPFSPLLPVAPTPFGFRPVAPAYLPFGYGYSYGFGYPPIAACIPFAGHGVVEQRVTVQIINPPGIAVSGRRVVQRPVYDTAGIDLDVESADKIWGPKKGLGKAVPAKNVEVVKAPLPEGKKPAVVAPAPPAPAPPPKIELPPEGQRLVDMGIAAFRKGEYGAAILRFRQASEAKPPGPRTAFLQGQACIAVGKFREAVQFIQMGLQREPTWPTSGFSPRANLYDNNADAWKEQRVQLEKAQRLDAKNADYLFLLGYLSWFDGQRDAAIDYFQQARGVAAEPRWSDMFLKAAAAKK